MTDVTLGSSWGIVVLGALVAWVVQPSLQRLGWRGGVETFVLGIVVGPVLGWLDPAEQPEVLLLATISATVLAFAVGAHTDVRWFREWDRSGMRGATSVAVICAIGVIAGGLGLWYGRVVYLPIVSLIALCLFTAAPLIVMQQGRLTPSSRDIPGAVGRALQRLVLGATALGLGAGFVGSLLMRHQVTTSVPATLYVSLAASAALILLGAWAIVGLTLLLPPSRAVWGAVIVLALVALIGEGLDAFAPFLGLAVGIGVSMLARPFVVWARRVDGWYGVVASPILLVAGASWAGEVAPWIFGAGLFLLLVRYLSHRFTFGRLSNTVGDGLHGLAWPTSALAFALVLESRAFDDVPYIVDWRAAVLLALAVVLVTSGPAVRQSLRLADPGGGLP